MTTPDSLMLRLSRWRALHPGRRQVKLADAPMILVLHLARLRQQVALDMTSARSDASRERMLRELDEQFVPRPGE